MLISHSQTSPGFYVSAVSCLSKTLWEKEKFLVTSNFSFSHSVFYPLGELSAIFIKFKIVACKLSIWKNLKFVVWERVKKEIKRFVFLVLLLISSYFFSSGLFILLSNLMKEEDEMKQ